MTPTEFHTLLLPGTHLSESQSESLNQYTSDSPFFTAAQLLKGKHEIRIHPEKANEIFEQYSIFAHDPVMYRLWVNDDTIVDTVNFDTSQLGIPKNKIQDTKPLSHYSPENPLFELFTALSESITTSRFGEVCIFKPKKEEVKYSPSDPQPLGINEKTELITTIAGSWSHLETGATGSQNPQSELIDRFMREEPAITPVKDSQTDFSDTVNRALKSSEYNDDDFLSETLAKIHQRQGNSKKAKIIYEKLQLKFPEKFTYFAGLLEEMRG